MARNANWNRPSQRHLKISVMVSALLVGSVMTWEQNTYDLTSSQISYSVSLGAIIGSINAAILVNFMGRKITLIMTAGLYFNSWGLITLTESHTILIIARFVSGLAIGLTSVVVPVYVSEVAEKSTGGALGALYFSMVNLGSFLMFILQTFSLHYICIEGLFACISAIFLLLLLPLPESPDFVRKSAAEHAEHEKSEDFDSTIRINSSTNADEITIPVYVSLKNLMFSVKDRMPLITLILLVVQTTCGLTTMKYLSSNGLVFMGSVENYKLLYSFLLFIEFAASVFHNYYLNYKKIRRKLLRSLCLMTCCLLIVGFYFKRKWYYESGQWPAIVGIILYLIIYNFDFGPVPCVILCDSFTFNIKNLRPIYYSMILTSHWTFRLVENAVLGDYLYLVGIHVFCWIFASTCITAAIFLKYTFPQSYGESSTTIVITENNHLHNV